MVYIYSSIEKDLPLRNLWCLINMYVRFTCAHNAGPFNNCLAHNQLHTRAVHKLLRQCKLKGTWKRYKLDFTWMDSSTLFLSTWTISITWLHSTDCWEHKKSITWRYAEHSDVANVTSAGYNGVNASHMPTPGTNPGHSGERRVRSHYDRQTVKECVNYKQCLNSLQTALIQ